MVSITAKPEIAKAQNQMIDWISWKHKWLRTIRNSRNWLPLQRFQQRRIDRILNFQLLSTIQANASTEEPFTFQPPRPPPNRNPRPEIQQPLLNVRRHPPLCWACGLPGHNSRFCQNRNSSPTNPLSGPLRGTDMARKVFERKQVKANVYVKLKWLGKDVPCLLDSGCDLTLVPKDLTKSCRNIRVKPTKQQIFEVNNTPIAIGGEVRLSFILDGHCLWTNALVSEDVEEVMLGIE